MTHPCRHSTQKKNVSVPSHSHRETDFTHVLPNSNNLNSLFNKRPVNENEERWHSRVFKILFWKQSHNLLFIQQRFRRSSWNVYDKFISWSGIGRHVLDSTCSKKKKKSITYGALMYCFSSSLSTSAYPMSPVMNLFRKKKRGWPAKDNHWQISPLRHVFLSKCIIIMWPPRGNVAEARWTRKRVFF